MNFLWGSKSKKAAKDDKPEERTKDNENPSTITTSTEQNGQPREIQESEATLKEAAEQDVPEKQQQEQKQTNETNQGTMSAVTSIKVQEEPTSVANAKIHYQLLDFPRSLEHEYGETLANRVELLKELSSHETLGIGPADLVHITFFDKKSHNDEVGQFFHLTGLDAFDEKTILDFLKMIKSNLDNESKRKHTGNYILTYCCVNIFSKFEIRVRLNEDNTSKTSVLSCVDGTTNISMDEYLWKETFVSCCIRSLLFNIDTERKFPGLVQYPMAIENENENDLCLFSSKRIVSLLCEFLPRCLESGWDTSQSIHPTVVHNYLTESLLLYLSIIPGKLVEFTLATLQELTLSDKDHELYYKIAMVLIIDQQGEMESRLIMLLNETLNEFLPLADSMPPRDINSFQLLNSISCLLNLQAKFLISRKDYELAVSVAKTSTELSLDLFDSWYYLAETYIALGEYKKALVAINSMPILNSVDKNKHDLIQHVPISSYYKRPLSDTNDTFDVDSHEAKLISSNIKTVKEKDLRNFIFGRTLLIHESKKGCIEEFWDTLCLELGPIYGPQGCNLINFVSPEEAGSISDLELLARNSVANKLSLFELKVYKLLATMLSKITWNGLLDLRNEIFIMKNEFENNEEIFKSTKGVIPISMREKRICEQWLDQLFLNFYQDLKLCNSYMENIKQERSGLEWELLGLTLLRICNESKAVACLQTSIMARFDPVSCEKLFQLYLDDDCSVFSHLNADTLLELLTRKIPFDSRFYDSMQILNYKVLYKLMNVMGTDVIRSKVMALRYAEDGIGATVNNMITWIGKLCLQE
ncbi:Chs6p NDAI_0G05430 [Naumovozyma dairenensis CBS 421]|uniref:Uncharacterized protein n=1 Tax=Naumovozyma dairenensis (strain ATCC 10597 / BCRC 20456 / CBS 421 / NBRC 0211 / NRRL Y-12639) TaxID=1071378 RepID=J7S4L9_NAUDC|nr:hypothetical protein NDAI_0G05430 [Naumovozyma dairenensis CBS 421]CCK73526.1 hypothetical protein NDAI_0G05430 [Naumovozyma dairenensis CBS 421]